MFCEDSGFSWLVMGDLVGILVDEVVLHTEVVEKLIVYILGRNIAKY